MAASDLRNAVSLVTGIRADALDTADLPWLSQKMVRGSPDGAGAALQPVTDAGIMRTDHQELTRSRPLARTHAETRAAFAKASPMTALKNVSKVGLGVIPRPRPTTSASRRTRFLKHCACARS